MKDSKSKEVMHGKSNGEGKNGNALPSLSSIEILKKWGVNPTPVRILVYTALRDSFSPLSLTDLEERLETVDRSSISRTLNLFKAEGLVHFFDDSSGSVKYEICSDPAHRHHDDTHVHFHCTSCGKTICLHSIAIPIVELPEGFSSEKINYIVTGQCDKCSKED